MPSRTTDTRRWWLSKNQANDPSTGVVVSSGPLVDETVEVMPFSEHERLRDAVQAVVNFAEDPRGFATLYSEIQKLRALALPDPSCSQNATRSVPNNDVELLRAQVRIDRLESALEMIAVPRRPDGTYNRSREACEQLAQEALAGRYSQKLEVDVSAVVRLMRAGNTLASLVDRVAADENDHAMRDAIEEWEAALFAAGKEQT